MFSKCRACLGVDDDMKFISGTQSEGKNTILMFTSVTKFEWIDNETVAPFLCKECQYLLESAYNFQKKCQESYEIIKKFLQTQSLKIDKIRQSYEGNNDSFDKKLDDECDKKEETRFGEISHEKIECKERQGTGFICNKGNYDLKIFNLLEQRKCDERPSHKCQFSKEIIKKRDFSNDLLNKNVIENRQKCLIEKNKLNKSFTCEICNKNFRFNKNLKTHLKIHRGETPYKCTVCGKAHKSKGQLVDHQRIHTGEKPYICHVCGKGFTQRSALSTHMKQHTGRPEECHICQKRFCRPSELKIHLRKHSGEKPFLCTKCGKAFVQKSHLTEHIKTHSDQRPHQCHFCDKAFKQKSLLTSHLQIHSGYKKFKCTECSYACFKAYRLQQHMKLHSGEDKQYEKLRHVCLVCGKSYGNLAMLNAHKSASHNAIL